VQAWFQWLGPLTYQHLARIWTDQLGPTGVILGVNHHSEREYQRIQVPLLTLIE